MNQNNIYQVNSESQIDEILQNNIKSLIVLVFSSSDPTYVSTDVNLLLRKEIKRKLSKKYKNVIFLYIDLNSYDEEEFTYTHNVSVLPFATFIWEKKELAVIKNALPEYIDNVIPKVFVNIEKLLELQKKEEYLNQNNQPINNQPQNNQLINNQPINNQLINNQPQNNQPINNQPQNNQPINNQPINNQLTSNQPINNQPINNQPINNQLINNQLINNQPIDNQPINEQINNQLINGQSINSQLINGQILNGQSINEQPLNGQQINGQQINGQILNNQINETGEMINMENNISNNEQIDHNQLLIEMQQVQEQLNHQEKMKKIVELRKKLAIKELEKVIKLKESQENSKMKKNNK